MEKCPSKCSAKCRAWQRSFRVLGLGPRAPGRADKGLI